jgi:quinol monooxygenase YgiN
MVGFYTKYTVHRGQGDALEGVLLQAAKDRHVAPECILFVVARVAHDAEVVWTSEIWTTGEAFAAALERYEVKEITKKLAPLLASAPERTEVKPVGGKGLPLVH